MTLPAFEGEASVFAAGFHVGLQIFVPDSILLHQTFDPCETFRLGVFSSRHNDMLEGLMAVNKLRHW